jgi:pimeloyl-ACP methyl ester carboxylesterase
VLLLHGFPELSLSWARHLPALAAAGVRAVAPDLRGYGETERRGPYDLRTLADDVAGLVRALGRERAGVVGHDWGGGIAWMTPHVHPEVVERLMILNCPHPATLGLEFLRNPRQLWRSKYMFWFQLPVLAEWAVTRREARLVDLALAPVPKEVRDAARVSFLRPGAASAAIGYYRAAFRRPLLAHRLGRANPIACPVKIVWGVRDRFLGQELIEPRKLAAYVARDPEIVKVDAGHFVQHEAPERVREELLSFFT